MLTFPMTFSMIYLCSFLGCQAEPFGNEELSQGNIYPYGNHYVAERLSLSPNSIADLRAIAKKSSSNWFSPYLYNDNEMYSQPERKRFFAFHPMARFRGISMDSGSPSRSYSSPVQWPSRGFRSFRSFVPSYLGSPTHPVPSEAKRPPTSEEEGILEPIVLESKPRFTSDNSDNSDSTTVLQNLNSMAPHRGSRGRNKISRFGIQQ